MNTLLQTQKYNNELIFFDDIMLKNISDISRLEFIVFYKNRAKNISRTKNTNRQHTITCKNNHVFMMGLSDIYRNTWCQECIKKDYMDNVNYLAISNNYVCLDTEFVSSSTKMNFRCINGHSWTRSYSNLKTHPYCSKCREHDKFELKVRKNMEIKKYTTNDNIFGARPNQFINIICEKGHEIKISVAQILYNKEHTCYKCQGKKDVLTLDSAKLIASQRNGICMSESYVNSGIKLQWKCHYGHIWHAKLHQVSNGSWCPECNVYVGEEITRKIFEAMFGSKFTKNKYAWLNGWELDGYNEELKLAFEYDGDIHYKFIKYIHKTEDKFKLVQQRDKLKNEICKRNNITLIRIPYYIKYENIQAHVTEECKKYNIIIKNSDNIDIKSFNDIYLYKENRFKEMHEMVIKKGGVLIDKNYISHTTTVAVKCINNHIFDTSFKKIQHGYWCPHCAQKAKRTTEDMQKKAMDNGGECISSEYINNSTKLSWKCKNGHIWSTVPKVILKGHWCPVCCGNVKI